MVDNYQQLFTTPCCFHRCFHFFIDSFSPIIVQVEPVLKDSAFVPYATDDVTRRIATPSVHRVQAIGPSGETFYIAPDEAIHLIKEGDAEPLGGFSIRLLAPLLRGLRGPSCGVQGSVRSKGEDGRPRLAYLEKIGVGMRVRDRLTGEVIIDYGLEREEIGRIHRRTLQSVLARS